MPTSISIIIPARDEALTIGSLVEDISNRCSNAEIIVVDDGSVDQTGYIASDSGAKVVRHEVSLGNGAAIKAGARAATGDVYVFMDADGQHSAKDIQAVLARLQQGYDLVVGARVDRKQHSSFGRWFGNRFYNWLASIVTNSEVVDLTSGFRAVRRDKFLSILHLLPNGFSYPTTSTMAFLRSGYQVAFLPVEVKPASNGSHIRIVRDGFRFLLIIFKIVMLYSPFKALAPLALLQLAVGIGLYMPGLIAGSPAFTNGMALLLMGSILTLSVGVLSEQLTVLLYK